MFYIAICDDDEYFRMREKQLVTDYLNKIGYPCTIDMFTSGEELVKLGDDIEKYHIFFLDINMDEMDGIEAAKRIRQITKDAYVVFVTAFITYSLEGYKVDAIRYLLKDDEALDKAIAECLETILYKMDCKVYKRTFEFQEGRVELYLDSLLYIDSNLHKLTFHMINGKQKEYTMYEKLDVIHELLEEAGFCRIHKSYLVNLAYVEGIERYKVELVGGINLAVSKSRYLEAKEAVVCYKGEL